MPPPLKQNYVEALVLGDEERQGWVSRRGVRLRRQDLLREAVRPGLRDCRLALRVGGVLHPSVCTRVQQAPQKQQIKQGPASTTDAACKAIASYAVSIQDSGSPAGTTAASASAAARV